MLRYFMGFFAALAMVLAKPVPSDSDDRTTASSNLDLDFQIVDDSARSALTQDAPLVAGSSIVGTNLVNNNDVQCTSEASTYDNQFDNSIQKRGIFRRDTFCPTEVIPIPTGDNPNSQDTVTPSTRKLRRPAVIIAPANNPCGDRLKSKWVTCGGPEVGNLDAVDLDYVLNCVRGKCSLFLFLGFLIVEIAVYFFHGLPYTKSIIAYTGAAERIHRRGPFDITYRLAQYCCRVYTQKVSRAFHLQWSNAQTAFF